MNLKDLLDCTGKLGRFKQGPMASALRHQKELLNGLKAFIPWSQQLSERRQQLLMETVVDTTAKIFKKVGQKLQLGPTVTIPRANATAVSAGVIRKTFLAAGRVLKATEALVVDWDKEDEEDMLSEDEEEKEEHDSPPKRKRPPKHVSFSPEPSTKQHSSPATSSRRAKASGRVRRAYHAALRIAKAVEEFPHALGDEIEWSIRPGACSDIADHVTGDCEIATLDDLEDARGLRACVPGEVHRILMWLGRDLARASFTQDGRILTRPRKQYTKEEFGYRLLQFARGMPDSFEREIHFYHMYILDLFAKMDSYDVNQWSFPPVYSQEGEFLHPCDTLGEKLWSPPDFKPRSQRFGELLSSREPKWGELDLSSHGVSLEAWRAFKSATTAIGAAVLVVTERVDRWAMLFRDDPRVDALVRSVAHGAGWQFDPARVDMSGENYVKAGFEHKVDEIHEEELRLKRVVPIPSHLAEAVHGVGVVDKDHSNFEKVRVVHNYSENEDWSVNSATDIPEQKWQSAADAMAFLRPEIVLMKRKVKPSHFSVDASTGTGMGGFLDGRDRASSQINYLELFSMFWALKLWDGEKRELEDGVAHFAFNAVALNTKSSYKTGVMLKGSVMFTGKDLMEIVASFSKTNQFSESEHKVLFRTVRYTAFCVVTLTRKALAVNSLSEPGQHINRACAPESSDGHALVSAIRAADVEVIWPRA
ncbi:hypothetical protein CYMTET_50458 [Cymbomonas tetramitiformis]|uniref:Uncharacterized protein n=1 Tax=Cymbomonas tetramitiformis TaxID=36881 RepID=A0AAE0BN56_9CHLO|nr:hypothetical protein CYMTET_50458 [Cymbomonas tetramitiformis]